LKPLIAKTTQKLWALGSFGDFLKAGAEKA